MAGLPAVPAASPAPAPVPCPLAAAAPPEPEPEPEPEPGRWSIAVVLATAMLHRPPCGRAPGLRRPACGEQLGAEHHDCRARPGTYPHGVMTGGGEPDHGWRHRRTVRYEQAALAGFLGAQVTGGQKVSGQGGAVAVVSVRARTRYPRRGGYSASVSSSTAAWRTDRCPSSSVSLRFPSAR